MIPANTNTIAIARSGVVHHHPPKISSHMGLASHGITRNCVRGPTRNAVSGEAIFSIDCPKPNTRPCLSSGTTFCMIVCSAASAIGEKNIKEKNPIAINQIEETIGKSIQVDQRMILTKRSVLTGLVPSPYLDTSIPPAMNPVLVTASMIPHASTETIESPYASMSAMNTHARKLLNIAKNIIAKSPDIPAMMRIVHLRSRFLSHGSSLSRCSSLGNVSVRRWSMTRSVRTIPIPTAQSIPSRPMISPENTDTTVKTRPLTIPTCPFALSLDPSSTRIVTSVESAIMRILPTTTPIMMTPMSAQSHGLHISAQVDSGNVEIMINAIP